MDWVANTREIMETERPDVVVASFIGDLPTPLRDANGAAIEADTPAFYRAWQQLAEQLSSEVHAANGSMYWVSPPPITNPALGHAARLFEGYRTITADHFLFSGRALAGPHGRVIIAKQTCGRRRTIRTTDGVHLTDDGARIYGQQIAHDLTSHFGILIAPKPC